MSDEPGATYGRMQNKSNDDDVKELSQKLSQLSFNIDRRNPFYAQLQEAISKYDINSRIQLKEQ